MKLEEEELANKSEKLIKVFLIIFYRIFVIIFFILLLYRYLNIS